MTADGRTVLYILSGIILLLAALILILSRRRGLPSGDVIYDDLSHDGTPVRPFCSSKYDLAGKPDLILRRGDQMIPVELKSTPGPERPYPSHVLQLAAYCLLIEENYGIRPEYGILRYRDREFDVPFDEKTEDRLLSLISRMRVEDPEKSLPPVCSQPWKCRHCGYADICHDLPDRE